ncbi:unnamed protein product [Anisakis simplex]|uniref:Nuclear pore complex protein Nup85 n=1 Tax=Anisakis simplex TaxID=6269 RepID=A0A0M3J8E1_ANISI|nr:unnamed protein product [Anisakis simplex]
MVLCNDEEEIWTVNVHFESPTVIVIVLSYESSQQLHPNQKNGSVRMFQSSDVETAPSCSSASPSRIKWLVSECFIRSTIHALLTSPYIIVNLIDRLSRDYSFNRKNALIIRTKLDQALCDRIDYRWDERISSIVYRAVQMECHLWILSTLGGAFSAMGDYYSNFAETAGRISVRQLRLAYEYGDPVLISRCKLYIALYLTQKCHFKKAAQIVR